MYFMPIALIPATIVGLIKGHVTTIVVNASGFAGYMLAAWCVRQGLKAEAQYLQSRLARPPRWPLKLIAAIITSLTTGLIAWLAVERTPAVSFIFAGGALLAMYLSYGFDPRRKKEIAGAHGYSGDEIFRTLEESARLIRDIERANDKIVNSELNQRIERICEIADSILAEIEADPRDIRRARKFLNVYLDGAKKVTEGYARTHRHHPSGELEQNFRNVLVTIESVFQEQRQKLLEDDAFDLDVQIEVLNTQLKREGIR